MIARSLAAGLGGVLMCAGGAAALDAKVYGPRVDAGEFELEWRTAGFRGGAYDGAWKHKLEAGYAPTGWWRPALVVELADKPGRAAIVEAVSFENVFELPTPEAWPLDLGIYAEYQVGLRDGASDEIELKGLAEGGSDLADWRANLIAERHVGAGASDTWEYGYALQARRAINDDFALGLEAYGDLGDSERGFAAGGGAHVVGPVVLTEVELGFAEFEVAAGWLFGVSDDAPDGVIKLTIELER